MRQHIPLAIAEVTINFNDRPVTGAELAALTDLVIEPAKQFVGVLGYHDGDSIAFGRTCRQTSSDHLLVVPSAETPFFRLDTTYSQAVVRDHLWLPLPGGRMGTAREIIESVRKFAAELSTAYLLACSTGEFPPYCEPRDVRTKF